MKDISLVDIEEAMRNYLIDKGWTPPDYSVKLELKGGNFNFSTSGEVNYFQDVWCTPEFGTTRQTKEQTEIASAGMLRRNRLSALAEAVGDGEKEWVEGDDNYYRIFYSYSTRKYEFLIGTYSPEVVYMNEETAKAVCKVLNEGKFEL